MKSIDLRRVIAGGLLAGLLYNVGGITIAVLTDLETTFARLGVEPTGGVAALHLSIRFGLGIVSVFLYAAIRPPFGPGPRTAIIAGLLMWLTAYVPGTILLAELRVFTSAQAATGIGWGVGEACVATLAGAWPYREEEPPSVPHA